MKKDYEKSLYMDILIWINKNSNGMFPYRNDYPHSFKNVHLNFDKTKKDILVIKTKDNYIQYIEDHKDFDENSGNEILFKIRKSLKNDNIYEVINPIRVINNFTSDYNNNFLKDKIWFPVKSHESHEYYGGNQLNYNLNENDIIKLGKKKYIISKIHFEFDNRKEKEKIKDENFYKNNNISYISLLNKKSKSVFSFDLKPNQYKINKNKNIITEKINQENVKENEINKVNKKEMKNINQNNNGSFIDNNVNDINDKNKINNMNNNISNKESSQNNDKKIQNNNPILPQMLSTKVLSNNAQNVNENIEGENESDNKGDMCLICFYSFSDINNPLVRFCNCKNYAHFECFKKYLTSIFVVTENSKKTVMTYAYKKFNCNLCFKPYHLRFRIPEFDKIYELLDLNLPEETDYFCLESLNYIKNNNNIKTVHIVKLINKEINVGRNNNNDIIDDDLFVSREHAVLKYDKNNKTLFLENNKGRYGTLVLVRGNIKVNEEKTYIQIGNTKNSIELKKK